MPEQLGVIITFEDSPSTSEFSFVVTADKNKARKGEYVQVHAKNGVVFGYISEIFNGNRYFERAETVASYESTAKMKENFPIDNWAFSTAQVKVLGICNEGKFTRVYTPPSPGNEVFVADEELLERFLGFVKNGLDLGTLQHHKVEAKLDLTRLLQKHLAILAMSGAGKSHLTSVLIEELLDRAKEQGRVAVVIVDIHGEYIGFKYDERYGSKTEIIDANDIKVPLNKVMPEMFEEWMPHLSAPQKELLRHALKECKKELETGYGFNELIKKINGSEVANDTVKRSLKRALREIKNYCFISNKKERTSVISEVKPGKVVILDFSSIDSLRKKQILVSMLARKLFRLRRKEKIAPFLLVLEEAHNFAREKAEESEAISRSVIETIAREGRKFGASLCLISQRPVNLSTTALSQCGTHIILRVTNPNDLDHIQMSSEGIDAGVSRSITGLKVGEAIVVGEAVNYPVFVSVRQRRSIKREKGAPLHEQAKKFEEGKARKEEQIEAFL